MFNNTRGSVLLAILFHAAGNVTVNVFPVVVPYISLRGLGEIVRWVVVCFVVVMDRPH